jgi:starch-binding outer membrane protein, SusD/RagB family
MTITRVLLAALVAVVAACDESVVPDINAPTQFPKDFTGLRSAFTGAAGSAVRSDIATYTLDMTSMARDAAYFTASEPRFITELTGEQPIANDAFGASAWNSFFSTIKGIDTTQSVLTSLTDASGQPLSRDTIATLWAQLETLKGLYYVYLADTRDTAGVPINAVGGSTSPTGVAPILCLPSTWAQIVAILDSAADSLSVVPAGTVLVSGLVPSGYSLVSDNATHWRDFTLALRAKAHIEYAYAIARGATGSDGTGAPTATSPGLPDVNQLDSAAADFDTLQAHGLLYDDGALSPLGNIGADPGVYFQYSTTSGDVQNGLASDAPGYFVLLGAAAQIDTLHDERFLVKFGHGTPLPTTSYDGGLVPASALGSEWQYGAGTQKATFGLSGVIPIVRNEQLHLLRAEALIGLGQYSQAIAIINAVRTGSGGLAAETVSPDYSHTRDFLLQELLVSLLSETGDHLIAIRNYGLTTELLTTWNPYGGDLHSAALPIPLAEASARNNNITPVCSGAGAQAVTPRTVPRTGRLPLSPLRGRHSDLRAGDGGAR